MGTGSSFQRSLLWKTSPYSFSNISERTDRVTASDTSAWVGQMSLRKTGVPWGSLPIGSLVRSMSIVPARA